MWGASAPQTFFRSDFFGTKYKSLKKRIVGWHKIKVDTGHPVEPMNLY